MARVAVPLRVRDAVEADGEAIGEAHAAAWLAAYSHIFESNFLVAAAESRRVGWLSAIQRHLTPPNILLVGMVADRVVAFAHAIPATAPDRAEIAGFYCHPDAWGSGVAAVLMARTTGALADRGREAFLWTLRDAARARRFYEKVGFRLSGSTRSEALTNWATGTAVDRPAVEYTITLAG